MSTLTVEQLKARAYDLLVQIQKLQYELQSVNQEIAKYAESRKNGSS